MARCRSGTWPTSTSLARSRLSISFMPASTSGSCPPNSFRATTRPVNAGSRRASNGSKTARSKRSVKMLHAVPPDSAELAETVHNEAEYFERNAARMRYPAFRAQGLFVGSGVVEAGCKTVIGSRLKCSGMFWTVRGANAIIALRCCRLSRRFEDYTG